jgi:hypothetical protein
MRFFFPDSQDLVDPSFDFVSETRAEFRVRQMDDLYAHEILDPLPFHGILVSRAIVDGAGPDKSGKYSMAQRQRLLRQGVKRFFRAEGLPLEFMGDCGAFTYKDEETPPFTVEDVVEFYLACGFDYGISVDHLILEFVAEDLLSLPGLEPASAVAKYRQELTLDLAERFLQLQRSESSFEPIGVAQGWSPSSYAKAVAQLQDMGYRYVAVGSMVPLKTRDIVACLEAIDRVRKETTRLHLLGVTRLDRVRDFADYGVASFDSTSPFLQAFKDGRNNYHTLGGAYTAIRVPQVEGNPRLQGQVRAGQVDGRLARQLEQHVLRLLREYDDGRSTIDTVLSALSDYADLIQERGSRTEAYRRTLAEMPWRKCECAVCCSNGVEVIIFRGTERNKRRGFHNLHVFRKSLEQSLLLPALFTCDTGADAP